jgi:hypothetical protein
MSNSNKTSKSMKNETEEGSVSGQSSSSQDRVFQIAEAAYYRAEKRGFEPGLELDDWFTAEQEINSISTGC